MKSFFPALLVALVSTLAAASTPAPARAEIETLLDRLGASGCQFNRNGSWYSAAEAREHLFRKLEYIEDKGGIQDAEQFIDLGASKSSFSGRPYQVGCPGEAPVESRAWLLRQLGLIRAERQ